MRCKRSIQQVAHGNDRRDGIVVEFCTHLPLVNFRERFKKIGI